MSFSVDEEKDDDKLLQNLTTSDSTIQVEGQGQGQELKDGSQSDGSLTSLLLPDLGSEVELNSIVGSQPRGQYQVHSRNNSDSSILQMAGAKPPWYGHRRSASDISLLDVRQGPHGSPESHGQYTRLPQIPDGKYDLHRIL